jgi:hypothetical protein
MAEHQKEFLSVENVMCLNLPVLGHKSVFCSRVNHIQLTDNEAVQQIHQGWGRKLLVHVKSVLKKHIKWPETVVISLDERHKLSGNNKPYTSLTGGGGSARNRLLNSYKKKRTRCTNFSNLFWNRTLHVSDSFSVRHQESSTVHTATGLCHTSYADCLLALTPALDGSGCSAPRPGRFTSVK